MGVRDEGSCFIGSVLVVGWEDRSVAVCLGVGERGRVGGDRRVGVLIFVNSLRLMKI